MSLVYLHWIHSHAHLPPILVTVVHALVCAQTTVNEATGKKRTVVKNCAPPPTLALLAALRREAKGLPPLPDTRHAIPGAVGGRGGGGGGGVGGVVSCLGRGRCGGGRYRELQGTAGGEDDQCALM